MIYHSTDHGVTIIIPEDAVSGKARLQVGVSLVGPFRFPENYRPVSAVVWININVPLRKRAELHMPHFVLLENEKDTKKLGFFLASDQSFATCSEFVFLECNYPVSFKPGSTYGTLWVDHFCSGCILEEVDVKEAKHLYYIARAFPKDRSQDEWMAEFVFSYCIPTCMEVCQWLCECCQTLNSLYYNNSRPLGSSTLRKAIGCWQRVANSQTP